MSEESTPASHPQQQQNATSQGERMFHQSLLPLTAAIPFCSFVFFHHKGGTVKLFTFAYKLGGIPGIIAVPALTISMEKCFYESVCCYQGIDPNMRAPGEAGFPHGGSMLPSFSLVAINKNGFYYEQAKQSKFSPHYIPMPPSVNHGEGASQ